MTGWTEDQAQALISRLVRLKRPMSGLQQGIGGTVTRAELIDLQWVVFIEWHTRRPELFEDPFDRDEWDGYIELC